MGYIYNNAYINERKVWNRKSKKENIMAKTKTTKIQTAIYTILHKNKAKAWATQTTLHT